VKIAPFTLKVNIYLSNFNKYFLQSDIVRRIKKNPAKQDSPPAAGRASDILPFRRSAILAELLLSYGNEVSYTIINNVPWHILAPRRGCLGNHLPLRRVRILAERFYRMETKFPIREQNSHDRITIVTLPWLFLFSCFLPGSGFK
jgi:hypothetical protein